MVSLRDWYSKDHITLEAAPQKATVYGVGYVRDTKLIRLNPQAYSTWKGMLRRCYSKEYKSYAATTVHTSWHLFDTFLVWHTENYIPGYALDKDLLSKGPKVYGPDTCIYITPGLNNILHSGTGVHYNKQVLRYSAQITINGRKKHLGYYMAKKNAVRAYRDAKALYLRSIVKAATYSARINKRLLEIAKEFEQ